MDQSTEFSSNVSNRHSYCSAYKENTLQFWSTTHFPALLIHLSLSLKFGQVQRLSCWYANVSTPSRTWHRLILKQYVRASRCHMSILKYHLHIQYGPKVRQYHIIQIPTSEPKVGRPSMKSAAPEKDHLDSKLFYPDEALETFSFLGKLYHLQRFLIPPRFPTGKESFPPSPGVSSPPRGTFPILEENNYHLLAPIWHW